MNIPSTSRFLFILALCSYCLLSLAQHRDEATQTIKDLCSEKLAGRGYINSGDKLAAKYISNAFQKVGLAKLSPDYFQQYFLDVNTFPQVDIIIDGKKLRGGYDYLIKPESGSVQGEFAPFFVSPKFLKSNNVDKKIKKALKKGFIPVFPMLDLKDKTTRDKIEGIKKCNPNAPLIFLKNSLTWSVGRSQDKGSEIWLIDSVFDRFAKKIEINITATLVKNYTTQNVFGYVPGKEHPDSFIIFCGHYDHLGKMGEATFYGANDNASGIAMLIDMASYFIDNPQKYSVAFVAFGAEEAGLVGSYHYVTNPIVPLTKTKFVFNMDLMGSGEKGATVVNGRVFKNHFDTLVSINETNAYLPIIKPRGKAANSDHYFFTEAGIPSFFMYLMGDYKHYHIPADNSTNLNLGPYYDKSFLLIRDFIVALNKE